MANIRQRGKKWQARITRKGFPDLAKTFTSHADAEGWARLTESQIERGIWHDTTEAEELTLGAALSRYHRERGKGLSIGKADASHARKLQGRAIARVALARVRGADLAVLRDDLSAGGLAPSTVKKILGLVSRVYGMARREWGMTALINPVQAVRLPREANARTRRLFPEELERLCAATESIDLPNVIALGVETAMRRGEMIGLKRLQVDLNQRVVRLATSKNGEGRSVPLTTRAAEILDQMPRRIDGRVFGITANAATIAFWKAVRRARRLYEAECTAEGAEPVPGYLEGLTLHDLRHEAISRLFERGLHPMEVASISGHKTLAMLKRYTHFHAADLARKLG
jgi:integrase